MPPNPYAAPKADVRVEEPPQPSEWQRVKWLFGGLWLMLTLLPLLNMLFVVPPAPNPWTLFVNVLLAVAVGVFIARDIWLLRIRKSPLVVDVLLYTLVLGGIGGLIIAKETKVLDWNSLHLDIPIFFLLGVVTLTAWLTEKRKAVRVYVGARHLLFVGGKDGL